MLWRSFRVACVCGVIAAIAAPGCGGNSSTSGGSSAGAGGSAAGAAGTGGSRPSAGASGGGKAGAAAALECGSKTCVSVAIPVMNFTIPACCADADTNQCGLDSSVLAAFGPTFPDPCQPLHQPGSLDKSCPDSVKTPITGSTLAIQFPGCCRPNNTCGYQLDSIGGIVPLGLGCVDSAPFLDGGVAPACGSSSAGAAGQAGAAGADTGAGAAGESAAGAGGT